LGRIGHQDRGSVRLEKALADGPVAFPGDGVLEGGNGGRIGRLEGRLCRPEANRRIPGSKRDGADRLADLAAQAVLDLHLFELAGGRAPDRPACERIEELEAATGLL